jgi:myosin heavy subunit
MIRLSIARELYWGLIEFLVVKVNSLRPYDDKLANDSKTLNLLDFTGYDSLPNNGLEQLLINLGNEKYSNTLFMVPQFQKEKKFMEDEGLRRFASEVKLLESNSSLIKILESKDKPKGLLSVLTTNSLSKRYETNPKTVYKTFLTDVHDKLFKNSDHITRKVKKTADEFVFNHSFYKVEYDPIAFLDQDRNTKLEPYFMENLAERFPIFSRILEPYKERTLESKNESLGDVFVFQTNQLQKDLTSSDIHYVFNIRANNGGEDFDGNVVIPQLKKFYIEDFLENTRLSYPIRIEYKIFCKKYLELLTTENRFYPQLKSDPKTNWRSVAQGYS